MPATREEVFAAINGERDYQDQKWVKPEHSHSVTEYLVYMRDYIEEALHTLSREDNSTAIPKALHGVRKITTLGVACMEENGALRRGE